MTVDSRLQSLGITLPAVMPPAASFVLWVRTGDLVFVSGHIAKKDGRPWVGQLGAGLATAEGQQAARSATVELLATLREALGGDLGRVRRIVKTMVLVNSAPGFVEQHLVANGASDLLREVFGPAGEHARTSFGASQIPFGACVEIDMVVDAPEGAGRS